jgi:hypothetical protein
VDGPAGRPYLFLLRRFGYFVFLPGDIYTVISPRR